MAVRAEVFFFHVKGVLVKEDDRAAVRALVLDQAVAVLIVTALLVFLLHGFVNRLERHGIPRWGGTTIAFLLIIAVIIACFMVLIPAVVSQLTSFTQQLPKYLAQIQDFVTKASSSTQLLDGESINALLTQAVSFIRHRLSGGQEAPCLAQRCLLLELFQLMTQILHLVHLLVLDPARPSRPLPRGSRPGGRQVPR